MFKMGLHDPFGWLKHKLWAKEGSGVKLAVWFPSTKSRESPWLPCVQVACHIFLKSSSRGLQLCFKPHVNQKYAYKVMGFQSCWSPNFGNFGSPTWESWDKMTFECGPWPCTKYVITGKVVASPKSGSWWILCVRVCLWFVRAPKVF
jgi:hypothetical protein